MAKVESSIQRLVWNAAISCYFFVIEPLLSLVVSEFWRSVLPVLFFLDVKLFSEIYRMAELGQIVLIRPLFTDPVS